MKILVTGGAGFIGTNFCHYIINKYPNYKVVCLDKLTYASSFESLNDIINNPNFKFVKGDICNEDLINELFEAEQFNVAVNFAAESHVERSIADPSIFINSNVVGVRVLLDACRKFNVRFHQISTDEVYGGLPLNNVTDMFLEDSVLKPSSPYSASKASADMLVMAYRKTFNLPVTISRCSNNFGPYQHPEKLIPLTLKRALNNESLIVHGTGLDMRDWIYVLDHCRAVDLIIHFGTLGAIYNIAGNNEITNLELMDKVCLIINKTPNKQHTLNRPCHDEKYTLNCSKIEKELGFKPSTNFNQKLENTVNWYLNNPEYLNK